jgi:hypothetical protein
MNPAPLGGWGQRFGLAPARIDTAMWGDQPTKWPRDIFPATAGRQRRARQRLVSDSTSPTDALTEYI